MAFIKVEFDPTDHLDEVSEEDLRAALNHRIYAGDTINTGDVEQALLDASELLRKHGSVKDIAAAHKLDIIRNERF